MSASKYCKLVIQSTIGVLVFYIAKLPYICFKKIYFKEFYAALNFSLRDTFVKFLKGYISVAI